jgi:Xaa-Pro aminopeptidase/Xaa-Pro dipeptidase
MDHDGNPFFSRRSRARSLLGTIGLGGILFSDLKNIRYLTGFSGSDGVLLILADRTVLLVDGRYRTQAAGQAKGVEVRVYEDKVAGIADALAGQSGLRLGFESPFLTVDLYLSLSERLNGTSLVPLRDEVRLLRAIKEDAEVALIREAAAVASRCVLSLLPRIRPGVRERDLAAEFEDSLRRSGTDGPSFPTIIASGENSALPHAQPGSRRLREGDVVIIDSGAVVGGYCSDETVTVALGPVDGEVRKAYTVVREALEEAMALIRPGVSCRAVDARARERIERAGWGPNFSHGTGHGVGLDVHEAPRLATRSDDVLEEGMVVTVEPGVYFPGQWGIRIENMVLVRSDGIEILSGTPKEWTVL